MFPNNAAINNNNNYTMPSPPRSSHVYRPPSPTTIPVNETATVVVPPERLHARPLSTTTSSFASLLQAASSQEEDDNDDEDQDQHDDDEALHARTPCASFREYDDDQYQDDIEATPRIGHVNNHDMDQELATPTRLVPFVPSLDRVEPPKSVNLDDIRRFPHRHYSHHYQNHHHHDQLHNDILAAAGTIIDNIPSDDPRTAIQHIRSDVTEGTNSSESLQLAIDFEEIKLLEVIGGGGFGQVYKAVWKGTPVAVKILTGSAQSRMVPRGILQEFAAELNLLRGMRHPNVCLLMGACLEPPHRAIVTELAAYGSLWDALRLPLHPPYKPCDGVTRDGWPEELYRPDRRHGVPPTSTPIALGPAPVPHLGAWRWNLVHKVACGAARGMACTYDLFFYGDL